ncbi:MAG: hypothetical protein MJA29_06570, partial [Candidatus Omnitrophica bacterium]|nr:hypothetical protein [Candidatus Omnitrophota bacterium]
MYGKKYVKSAPESVVIPDVEGWHYVYFEETAATLVTSYTIDPDLIIADYAFVIAIYWSSVAQKAIFIADERHGLMQWTSHLAMHQNFGSTWEAGFSISNLDLDGDGDDDEHAQFSVDAGEFDDEDIHHILSASGYPAQIPIYYLTGTGQWLREDPTNAPVKNYSGGAGRAAYMEWSGSAWVQEQIPNTKCFWVHIFATPDDDNPYVTVQPTQYYENVSQASPEMENDLAAVVGLNPPFMDHIIVASVLYQTSSAASNTWKSRTVTLHSGESYGDWRSKALPGGSPSSHTALVDRDLPNSHPAHSISVDTSSFNRNLSVVDDTVLQALQTIDQIIINLVFQAYNSTGAIDLRSTYWADLTWTEEVRKDAGYVHVANSAEISFVNAGDYLVVCDITTEVTVDDRTSGVFRFLLNGVEIEGTRTATYQRLSADPYGQATINRLITVPAGAVLKV